VTCYYLKRKLQNGKITSQ